MNSYTSIREIGRGGFGVVEEVEDSNGNRFARKTFAPSSAIAPEYHDKLRKRFRREVITQQELGGTEILPVFDHHLEGDTPWFVMPLAQETYQKKINEDKALGSIDIEPIADILNGLQRLHDLGYVHRDLNPNNILLYEGTWRLSDLGAILPPSGNTVTLTEDTIIYTEAYCAPEQRLDFHAAQPPADIYSFGCILHDFFGTTARTPYAQHFAPGSIGVIIEKCTDKNPKKRPSIKRLRTLVLEALIEEGGHCQVEDTQSAEWLEKLKTLDDWNEEDYENFARFFANLDFSERSEGHNSSWVYSLSTPFLTRISSEAMRKLAKRRDGIASRVIEKYCDWVRNTLFLFNFADNICGRLTEIFDHGGPADQACAFAALVQLGYSHNRWYVMRSVISRCTDGVLSSELAKRLAIELKTEELESSFCQCIGVIDANIEDITPDLAKFCKSQ